MSRGFASDNSATIHPEVLAAIERANTGHAFGYGHDDYTRGIEDRLTETFGAAAAYLVFNGTGANVLGLRAACRPWEAVICAQSAHLNTDECGAPEAIAGVKLLPAPAEQGKLTPERVRELIVHVGDEHAVQPRMVSISQSTELGTVYALEEVRAIAAVAHQHGLLVHLDGARLSNAAAALGVGLAEASPGVDVLSFGGTKNGLMLGEAVVLFDSAAADGFAYLRKQSMQLASKMRYLAAQFDALLTDELWLRCAGHANAMASALAEAVDGLPGLTITRPVQANAVFAILPSAATEALLGDFPFYVWDEATGEVRWMCSWDTTPEDVERFAGAVRAALS